MTLKNYQVKEVAFLQNFLEDTSKSCAFLADEIKLGKTSKLAIFLGLVEFFLTEHFSTITLCYSRTIQKQPNINPVLILVFHVGMVK